MPIAVNPRNPRGIIWLASYPRSGNTWLRVFVHHLIRLAEGKPMEDNDLNALNRTSMTVSARVDLYERFLGKPPVSANPAELAKVRPMVQREIMEEGRTFVFAKTNSFFGRVFEHPLIDETVSAGAVYIVRNPLDVAVSLAAFLGQPVSSAIDYMGTSLFGSPSTSDNAEEPWGSWTENVGSWTTDPPPVVKVVRYEDLVEDPRTHFSEIVEHLRFDVSDNIVRQAIDLSAFDRLQSMEKAHGFVERPDAAGAFFRSGRAGEWRDALTPEQIERIVADHGAQMARFGYMPSH